MTDEGQDDLVEAAFRLARGGDRDAFAAWMSFVEMPLRLSLRRYARVVDVEVVVQETLLRMWLVARDPGRELQGRQASLKFAFGVARNVVLEELRRNRQDRFVDLDALENLPEGQVAADPPDPSLRRAIEDCIRHLPGRPHDALSARVHAGGKPDRELAAALRMTVNTFLQNIVRARRLLRKCLEKNGVHLEEVWS